VIRKYWKIKNIKMKFKLKVKVTSCVKALIASMLLAVLTDFALYSPTTGDNAPQKGRYLLLKTTEVVTQL
jgi:hypothetical protein